MKGGKTAMNKEKSLIIFNKNGTTLEFEKVTNFVEIAGNCTIAFTYPVTRRVAIKQTAQN